MKTKFTFIILVISFYSALSQDEKKLPPHDIGFNTNIVLNGIFNSNGGLYSFIYKRQVAENAAFRYGVDLSIRVNTNPNSSTNYSIQNNTYISPSLGKEWQYVISKKWIWYYGADVRLSYQNSANKNFYFDNSVTNDLNTRTQNYGVALTPFLGLRFTISDKLYLATEAYFNFAYNLQKTYTTRFISTPTSPGSLDILQDFYTHGFNANTVTGGGIFVFYRF